jgi:chromosome segregation ATPase
VNNLKKQFDRVSQELKSLRESSSTLTIENQRLAKELESASKALRVVECQMNDSGGTHSLSDISAQILTLQHENADLQRSLEASRTEHTRLRQLTEGQTLTISKLQDQLTETREKLSRSTCSVMERLESEKTELKVANEAALAQLRRELESQRTDLQDVSARLNETQASAETLRSANEQLVKQNRRLKTDLKAVKLLQAKEKRLSELSAVASRVAVENELTQRIDELKTRTEIDKRRLYGLGAEAFNRFFNPLAELDERSFRSVVHKAREELERLTAADQAIRRLVNASEHQTTEDAVARLVLRPFN